MPLKVKETLHWTPWSYSISHYIDGTSDSYSEWKKKYGTWVTVQKFDDGSAILSEWFSGCGFNPTKRHFKSVEEAKKFGEKVVEKSKR